MRFIELFAGAGGMGLGLEAAGMEHLLSFERDAAPHSVLVHAGKTAIRMDLKDVGNACLAMRHQPTLIAGGPPCQDFSKAGQRKITDRAKLTQHFAQIICVVRPEWFVFENVEQAGTSSQYKYARALWKRHGYGLTEHVFDAQEYGVPQRRRRLFCIGRLGEIDGFLLDDLKAAAGKKMVVRDILDPEREDDAALLEKGAFFARPWMGKKDEPNGRGILSIDEVCPTIARHTHEKPGPSYQPHPDDAATPDAAHYLTMEQVARIQGFPSGYDFRRKKEKYAREGWPDKTINLMVANAVPMPMAQKIGKVIFDRHYAATLPKLDKGFTDFLYKSRKLDPVTKDGLSQRAVDNIRSLVNRALRRIDGKMQANPYMLLHALETSVAGDGKFSDLTTRLQSDLRQCLLEYHNYCLQRPRSQWSPTTKMPEFRERFRKARKPGKWKGDALAPASTRPVVSWPPAYSDSQLDPEMAVFETIFREDFAPDPYAPQPLAGDPDEHWRPDGYDDPTQDPLYHEYLAARKDDD
ncbi:DNA cytosine methyltransferase [Neorhizobium sp. NPDC001467]|uniref:DNA cytosine methyltransferase n=1 Tax=Neorhizobium sp. NPDC001467 TaxID=3390595 RepID=UPI003D067B5B